MGRLRDECGSHIVEVGVATGLIAIAVIGLAGAMNLGVATVGSSRQRSVGASVASRRVEAVRNMPYSEVALDAEPAHSVDPDDPDHHVSDETPPRYDVNQDGSLHEPFVVGGSVKHIEDPVTSGPTEMYVHQYVTWVDDAGIAGTQDYKRVTVVVTWKTPLAGGDDSFTTSTFVSDGDVDHTPAATPTPAPSATPAPTPAPGGGSDCAGAPTGSVVILSGSGADIGYTNSTTVQVRLQADVPEPEGCTAIEADLSNDGSSFTPVGTVAPGVAETMSWTIPTGDATKTISARFTSVDSTSPDYTDEVILDQTQPTVPGSLRQVTCSMSGADRAVTLTWDASTDDNLSGYRLYRSVNAQAWEGRVTTSSQQADDTSKKNHESVRYLVRAYDRAGNESSDSSTLTYGKNSCSPA